MTNYQLGGLSRGVRDVRDRLIAFMAAKAPEIIDAARDEWNLQGWELPHFRVFDGIDPFKVVQFPAFCVSAATDSNHEVVNALDDAALETWPLYNVIVSVAVLTPMNPDTGEVAVPEFDKTALLRDDLTALVQNLLVNSPGLLDPGNIHLQQNSINTTYQEPFQPSRQPKQWVAAAFMSLTYKMRQLTWQPQIGTANTIEVAEDLLP